MVGCFWPVFFFADHTGTYSPAAMFLMTSTIRGEPGASAGESAYPLACGENMQFVA